MRAPNQGFTLIELVIVVVLLGILAAVAVPKFIDLSIQAETAGLQGVVGSVESAAAINFAARKTGDTTNTISISIGDSCATKIDSLLQSGELPSSYSIDTSVNSGNITAVSGNSSIGECTIKRNDSTKTAQLMLIT